VSASSIVCNWLALAVMVSCWSAIMVCGAVNRSCNAGGVVVLWLGSDTNTLLG
jgi:hypothetical protein